MSPDKLARMVNQIATFFESQPHEDKADRVANHLKEFWEPRMLEHLKSHLAEGGEGLSPLALDGSRRVVAKP